MTLRQLAGCLFVIAVWSSSAGAQTRAAPPKPVREKDLLPDPTPGKSPERAPEVAVRKVDLRPKFEKGQELKYTLTMGSSTRQTPAGGATAPAPPHTPAKAPTPRPGSLRPKGPGSTPDDSGAPDPAAPLDMSSKVTMGLRMKVVDVSAEAGATVELLIENLKASIQSQDTTMEFDSTKPAKSDDVAGLLFQSIAGTKLTLSVDRNGTITRVTGGEALAALGQAGGAGAKPGDLFSGLFSTGKASGEAAVGESWENRDQIDSPLMGGFRMVTRHTLASLKGRDAVVDVKGRIEAASEAPGSSPFTINNAHHEGRYVWDTQAGALRQMESRMSSEIRAKIGEQEMLTRSESSMGVTRQK